MFSPKTHVNTTQVYFTPGLRFDIYLDRPGGMREAIRRPVGDGVLDNLTKVFLSFL